MGIKFCIGTTLIQILLQTIINLNTRVMKVLALLTVLVTLGHAFFESGSPVIKLTAQNFKT